MDASIETGPALPGRPASAGRAVRGVRVSVPVRMLKCGDRHMEANLYKALKAPEPPAEGFIVATFESLPDISDNPEAVEIQGRLTIASVERTVSMSVKSDRLPDGTRRARGSVPIRMTDFGITPPRPWGGLLRTSDKVLVQFEIFIEPLP